ncbi:hypothetical protein ACIBL8_21695 [Streptomyces sp. NPDC050523]|uniref:hypothetical protein n=1 Tax=Streptomyces sp. NPDC050523 TaxID=3365622 RepID=UPI0037AE39B6
MNPLPQRVAEISVCGGRAAALQQVTSLLDSASVALEETQELLALVQTGAVEGAQGDVLELTERPPEDSTALAVQGWVAAVQALSRRTEPARPGSTRLRRSRWRGSWRRPSGSSPS